MQPFKRNEEGPDFELIAVRTLSDGKSRIKTGLSILSKHINQPIYKSINQSDNRTQVLKSKHYKFPQIIEIQVIFSIFSYQGLI